MSPGRADLRYALARYSCAKEPADRAPNRRFQYTPCNAIAILTPITDGVLALELSRGARLRGGSYAVAQRSRGE